MTVKQLMSANVVTIDDQASCREAVALRCRHKIRHLGQTTAAPKHGQEASSSDGG